MLPTLHCVTRPRTAPLIASKGQKRAVLAHAASDRRAILAGLVVGVASLSSGKAHAEYATPVDLFDDRKRVKGTGWEIIEEARDFDLPQNVRDGIDQYRKNLKATKARFQEATKRIEGPLGASLSKNYWAEADEELHNQLGNFRQDVRTLIASMGTKRERKEGAAKAKTLMEACDELDYAIKSKDQDMATRRYAAVKDELKSFTSFALG